MSIKLMNDAWLCDLPPQEKLVLLSMADQASNSGHCWPALKSISARCGRDQRSVRRWLRRLVDKGHISRAERPGTSNMWQVHPAPSIIDDVRPQGEPINSTFPQFVIAEHDWSSVTWGEGMTEMTGGLECHTPPVTTVRGGMTPVPPKPPLNPNRTVNVEVVARDPANPMQRIVEAWNAMAKATGLPHCMVLSDKRAKALRARLKVHTEDKIITAINVIPTSPFLRGQSGRWRADFDFLIQPDSILKILEGKYNDRGEPASDQGDGFTQAIQRAFDDADDAGDASSAHR